MTDEEIARVAHEVNRAACEVYGDYSPLPWEYAPAWQKESVLNGIKFYRENPNATPEDYHRNWRIQKYAEGWSYGQIKNIDKKQHPCLMAFSYLPLRQRLKDYLFLAVVRSLID